ncbi:competence type IV pilus minor pilin ComGD [Niallia endozanthoxylica]|uniref:Prepilin-type N-terminal cleavage/methylation domain-containing protein n=1 Tax=Niallia endozanthoxylica TaxID=2036016 RepID=A0A5J5HWK5_9BACI|nr:competence type IV pilus minor pilin ComGD [Niallia endozanthoxylica]KAA9026277.1 prepilin-type N-terminal cleavage/methylation domain-containing protein [Niallia endozanthoxylica]
MKNLQRSNQSGFTLIEMLLVLSIVLLISFISSILVSPQYLLYEKERFFSQFKADMLYSQQYAISQQKQLNVKIYLKENRYEVKEWTTTYKPVIVREIPKSIRIEKGTFPAVGNVYMDFNLATNGRTNRFGTFYFLVDDNKRYKVTFQLGAGRLYVVEE